MSDPLRHIEGADSPVTTRERILPGRSIAIASGKGGVGKTTFAANLSVLAAEADRDVLLADFDLGLANLDVVFRLDPGETLRDVLRGTPVEQCVRRGPRGIRILPASSGHREMAQLASDEVGQLLTQIGRIAPAPDVTILDVAAGIGDGVIEALLATDDVVIVTTPDPSAITDAYALIKVLAGLGRTDGLHLAVNLASSRSEAFHTASKISRAAESFLSLDLQNFTWLGRQRTVTRASLSQRLFVESDPTSEAAHSLRFLASRLLGSDTAHGGGVS